MSSHWLEHAVQSWVAGCPEQVLMQLILSAVDEADEAQPVMQLPQSCTVCVGGQEQLFSWMQLL
jgi:pyruvate/2-oxoacid:ferredoxin oxidoreductase beta subunit